jgi:hypothetical protein
MENEHKFALGSVKVCKYSVCGQSAAPKVKEGGTYNYRFALKGQCNITELHTLK